MQTELGRWGFMSRSSGSHYIFTLARPQTTITVSRSSIEHEVPGAYVSVNATLRALWDRGVRPPGEDDAPTGG